MCAMGMRKASATAYYKGPDSLWVKVVSNGEGARLSGPGAGGTSVVHLAEGFSFLAASVAAEGTVAGT